MSKLVCISLLFLFSCGGTSKAGFQDKNVSDDFEIIFKSDYSGVPIKSYRIVRNNEDYRAFFISMKEDKIPKVNFEKSNVLILNMGAKTSGGYNVSPEKMIDDGKKLIMVIKETLPKSGEMVTTALTSPVCIVKINSKKEVILK